ncbi:hypothetical protein NL676_008741 [Syzygium grande]|nr:hypothetical protein NL676_008741 [Syzygium grande]
MLTCESGLKIRYSRPHFDTSIHPRGDKVSNRYSGNRTRYVLPLEGLKNSAIGLRTLILSHGAFDFALYVSLAAADRHEGAYPSNS